MDFKLKQLHLWMVDTTRRQVEVDFYLPGWLAGTTRRQVEELPCNQVLPAFSILQFLSLTRKPGFQSSWNRKLVNFDFLIFFEQKKFFENFFLVKNYEISDFVDSSYRNMNHFYPFIFSLHERGRLKFYFYQFILKR